MLKVSPFDPFELRSGAWQAQHDYYRRWIPAFARMTKGVKTARPLSYKNKRRWIPAFARVTRRVKSARPLTYKNKRKWIPAFAGKT